MGSALQEVQNKYDRIAKESDAYDEKKKKYSKEYSDAFDVDKDGAEILQYLDPIDKERFHRAQNDRDSIEIGDLFLKASDRYFDVLAEDRIERESKHD